MKVCAIAEDGLAAIAAARRHQPDVALVDVAMPKVGGVEVVVEIKRWCPKTRLVVFTGVRAAGIIASLVDAGVDGLFSKASANEVLYEHLPHIRRGGRYIAPPFLDILERAPDRPSLSARERQTLNFIVRGKSNKEIAADLGISAKTVDKHRSSLMNKLGVHSLAQLLSRALKDGLIDPSNEL